MTMWFVTEELVDNTWKVICHYRDYMEAHDAMHDFERQDFGIVRVSHFWECAGVFSGKYHRVTARDLMTPEAADILITSAMANDDNDA